jgi:hypothetical protein
LSGHLLLNMEAVAERRLHRLHAYWRDRRRGAAPPSREDIDPSDLKELLPNLALIDVEDGPRRYRFRLVGTEIVARYGQELTGKRLDEVELGSELASISAQYDETVMERAPTYCRHELTRPGDRLLRYERLLLPLSRDGIHVDMLLGGYYELGSAAPLTSAAGQGEAQEVE